MKLLTVIRHAKSSWDDANIDDHDRPLNARGLRDAPHMAKVLRKEGIAPEVLVASTALRALTTAEIMADELGIAAGAIRREPRLYDADADRILKVVQKLDDDWTHVAIFGHNPGFEELVELLTGDARGMPTCSVAHIELHAVRWRDVRALSGRLQAFLSPDR